MSMQSHERLDQHEVHAQDERDPSSHKPTPLPKFQLFITLMIQFSEPITALVIYPFINQLVRDTGINQGDEAKTGYYAGMIESAFFMAECLSVVQWGYISDRFGRRPVLLIGPVGLAFSAFMFGLSSTFWQLLAFRCLQGLFNGNIGVAKSVIAEITDDSNIGEAYGYNPLMWSFGVTLAPFIGGLLSKPAERWPSVFGRIELFRAHPYFLPCATCAAIAFGTFLVGVFGLKETHPTIVAQEKAKNARSMIEEVPNATTPLLSNPPDRTYDAIYENAPLTETQTATTTTQSDGCLSNPPSLYYRPLLLVYLNYAFLTFCDMANTVLIPLVYSTPIEYGGLGLEPVHIGTALGTFGCVNGVVQSQIFGRAMRRLGTRRLYQIGFSSLCISFLIFPVMTFFAAKAGRVDAMVVFCMVVQFCSVGMIYMAYGTIQVLIVQSIPEGGALGTANGIGQMIASGLRTVAPTIASSLFSVSIQRNLLNGNLSFYLLFGLTFIGARVSLMIIEPSTLKRSSRSHN